MRCWEDDAGRKLRVIPTLRVDDVLTVRPITKIEFESCKYLKTRVRFLTFRTNSSSDGDFFSNHYEIIRLADFFVGLRHLSSLGLSS